MVRHDDFSVPIGYDVKDGLSPRKQEDALLAKTLREEFEKSRQTDLSSHHIQYILHQQLPQLTS
ncbi:hypothetical protein [Legionella longbeachae]|uniref:Uncharacterized protein n=1 Tax=Legionella longbeachae serogroup 1 (strain NSW150) TaxID=661367 RepID=D3HNF8_LEGLN|nr:hypothetical protein [Legionella longbeachae]VEE00949.1 Uncharacterised protein [Legionella oakridgensis]HBD7399062.1 hypothetical protein [Legionella pneumophila]ARB92664.1 hypothetical protein A6J40_10960 [Legionella longbeachae]ARM34162.1 hypothetical protein B0B39_11765 [Legionella longbeachae]EEZ96588.1 hypothetical protein LLB_1784 [Legionella longbeachae D-4968]